MENYNFVNELFNKINLESKNIIPANIMLIGKTGVGKSTLINNIFRENLAETGIGIGRLRFKRENTYSNAARLTNPRDKLV